MKLYLQCLIALSFSLFFQWACGDTMIFYTNGIWTTEAEARESATVLYGELKAKYPNLTNEEFKAAIKMGVAFNQTSKESGNYMADLFDSFVQFSEQSSSQFWRVLAGIETTPDSLQEMFASSAASIDKLALVTNADVEQHVNLYRQALNQQNKVVIVAHSQGNFYANQSFGNLAAAEQNRVGLVPVATPDNSVAGQVQPYIYTTLFEDFIWTIPGALPYNITNGGTIPRFAGHSFIESYLAPLSNSNSKSQILNQVINYLDFSVASSILQPGPGQGKDIWTTSVFCYCTGGGGPGGGLDNYELMVGGWGDEYYSLMEFDLTGLPAQASSARIELFALPSRGGGTTGMYLDRITQFWDWKTQGTGADHERLWWADRPAAVQWAPSALPAPIVGQWYSIDITDLYNAWNNGTYPNYGIQLRPVSTDNRWDEFYSSDYLDDPSLRPKLVVVPSLNYPPAHLGTRYYSGTDYVTLEFDTTGAPDSGAFGCGTPVANANGNFGIVFIGSNGIPSVQINVDGSTSTSAYAGAHISYILQTSYTLPTCTYGDDLWFITYSLSGSVYTLYDAIQLINSGTPSAPVWSVAP